MRITEVIPQDDGVLQVVAEDGRTGTFDVRPYLESPAFQPLKDKAEFAQVRNGGYFVEWRCGADLSADTIEARWKPGKRPKAKAATGHEDGAQRQVRNRLGHGS